MGERGGGEAGFDMKSSQPQPEGWGTKTYVLFFDFDIKSNFEPLQTLTTIIQPSKGCLPKKNSIWRGLSQLGGEGVKKNFKMSRLKIHFYLGTFFREGGGQIIISFVLSVEMSLHENLMTNFPLNTTHILPIFTFLATCKPFMLVLMT